MLEKNLNIGIIGPGRVAERHAIALQNIVGANLWSIAARTMEQAKEFATTHHAVADINAYDDIALMLADPKLHAVIITTPDKLHAEQCLLALLAGKAVLVEKPLCTSVESGNEILNCMQNTKGTLAVAYHLRWHDGLRKLAHQIHRYEHGEIQHMRLHWAVNFTHRSKWRSDKRLSEWLCMTVLGTHLIDIIRWMLVPICGEIKSVKSFIKMAKHDPEFEETVLAILQFESGATAEMFCSLGFDSPFQLEIYGNNQTIIGNDLVGKQRKIVIDDHELDFEMNNPYINQLEDFIQIIHHGKMPEVSLEQGIKNIETIKIIMRSSSICYYSDKADKNT